MGPVLQQSPISFLILATFHHIQKYCLNPKTVVRIRSLGPSNWSEALHRTKYRQNIRAMMMGQNIQQVHMDLDYQGVHLYPLDRLFH